MTFFKRYLLFFFILILIVQKTIGQNINKGDLDVRFLKEHMEIPQDKSFFNILYLKNKSDKPINLNVQFNAPKDWNIIGNSFEKYTVQAYSEISIPVRVTVSKNVKGGVGYAVIAIVSAETGGVYSTAYSFIKIPIISSVKSKVENNFKYFNQKNLKSKFEIVIENTGNIDEIINIKFAPDKSLTVEKDFDKIRVDDINIKSGETKIIRYNVKLDDKIDKKKYQLHKLRLNINTHDTTISKRVWFRYMDWKYKNITPENKNPLNIDLDIFNIFSNTTPTYFGRIYGDILLKKNKDIYYSFQNYNRKKNGTLWENSKIETQLHSKKTDIFLGDYSKAMEHFIYGRGIAISQKLPYNIHLKGVATKKIVGGLEDYGLSYSQKLNRKFSFELGGVYSQNRNFGDKHKLGFGKVDFNIKKNNISLLYGNSVSNYGNYLSNTIKNGWGYRFNFSRKIKNVNIDLNSNYGSPFYFGYLHGRLTTVGNLNIKLDKRKYILIKYSEQVFRPVSYQNNQIFADRFSKYKDLSTTFYYTTKNNFLLYVSPIITDVNSNNLTYFNIDNRFGTLTSMIEAGTKTYSKFNNASFSFSAKYGITNIYQYSTVLNGISYDGELAKTNFSIAQVRGGYKQRNYGLNFVFYIGPYNVSQQFAYFYSSFYTKSIMITPFYEKFLLNEKLRFVFRASYINNLTSKTTRANINSEIDWLAGKGWMFKLYNTTSFQSVKNSNRTSSYNTSYFQFGISKSFNIQQPRLKYYNYKAIFYKDLNGNRIHDPNEPGVSDVLTEINRANPKKDLENENYNGEFLSNDLFSNENGEIQYVNIAEGDYKIKYTPQDIQTDNFDSESNSRVFSVNKDTVVYIPFMERNKLFGKITLHRTKHSALGKIPINNIKVTVEGNANTYSTITDKDGYFELYIPVSDYYKVRINNIFHEHFNLRQDYYIVKFNGYKQFEVSFDFDEKERKIAFDESDFLITDEDLANKDFSFDDIKVIKQTNLKGVVKDANSLLPLHATISLHNVNTNQLISETASSKRTGVYFTSFFAGEDYSIKASSHGYWVYQENLNVNQITTFENITHDILLNEIFLGEEIKTDNLKFDNESAELSPLAKAELDVVLTTLFLNPTVHIEILGHTDNLEALITDATKLSESRASAVASYLVKHGLKESKIKIKGLGETDQISFDDTNEGRQKNRSVQIKVTAF